jgi:prepilin-type processing-associated H-X9-DG protein
MLEGFDHDIVRWCSYPPVLDSSYPTQLAPQPCSSATIDPNYPTCWSNSGKGDWCAPNDNSFGSAHPAGVNFVYCDGSVRLISFQINTTTYSNLGCRKDGNVIESY